MPELQCPRCAELIRLPSGYNWYDGEVLCRFCKATIKVQIGEFRHASFGTVVRLVVPESDSGKGGAILRQPEVVEIGNNVPRELIHGTDAELVPDLPRKVMRTALWHYREGRYEDAVVRCRVLLEAVLKDQGVADGFPGKMVKQAIEDRLLPGHYGRLWWRWVGRGLMLTALLFVRVRPC